MADIKLRIEVNPNAETETLGIIFNKVNNVGSNTNLSNASFKATTSGIFYDTSNPNENGREMLSWGEDGKLKFTSQGYLSNNGTGVGTLVSEKSPDMFVWGVVPSTKKYSVKLTFSEATALKDIIVYGDKTSNQFPTKAIIDGTTTVYSDDPRWAINMGTEKSTHTIEFTEWNRANYNACLTSISIMLKYLEIDKSQLDDIESTDQEKVDASTINYGFVANTGSATIRDIDGELQDYIKDGLLPVSNVPVDLYYNHRRIRTHITSDSDYSTSDQILKIQLTNTTDGFDRLFEGMQLAENKTALEVLKYILTKFGYSDYDIRNSFDNMVIVKNADGTNSLIPIKEYLGNIKIPYAYLEQSSYHEAIDKVCQLAQLNAYLSKNKEIEFSSVRPVFSLSDTTQTIVELQKYNIFGDGLKTSLFNKNKINTVGYVDKNESLTLKSYVQLGFLLHSVTYGEDSPDVTFLWSDTGNPQTHNTGFEILSHNTYTTSSLLQEVDGTKIYQDIVQVKGKIKFTPQTKVLNFLGNQFYSDLDSNSSYKILNYSRDLNNSGKYLNTVEQAWDTAFTVNLFGGLEVYSDEVQIINGSYIFPYRMVAYINWRAEAFGVSRTMPIGKVESVKETLWYRTLAFSDSTVNQDADFVLPTNEILYKSVKYNEQLFLTDIVIPEIISDYKNGVSTATLDIFCGEFKTTTGEKYPYDTIERGTIIKIAGDKQQNGEPRYWRVVGSTFNFNGSPTQRLQLQEVKAVETN